MSRHSEQTRRRLAQTASRLRGLAYPQTVPPDRLLVSGRTDRIGWEEAERLDYRPAALGEEFGPLFATYWFRIEATVPAGWAGSRIDLLWDSGSEATLWRDGRVIQGLYSGWRAIRTSAPVVASARGAEHLELAVEVACNSWAGDEPPIPLGTDVATAARWRLGRTWDSAVDDAAGSAPVACARLERCGLGRFDPEAVELWCDFEVLARLEEEHTGLDPAWAGALLRDLNRFCNEWEVSDRATWPGARAILKGLLEVRGAQPRHRVFAVAHGHLDTAWVWPIPETRRKFVRTVANQLGLIDRYPGLRFAASSAQHYAWLEQDYPELFRRLAERVADGSWEPVGGAWVEPDCNLPSGESLVRQLLYGQAYFDSRFGRRSKVFWSPDSFGHNAQMPQILRECGLTRFITQKLSWNQFTHPPHNSFRWQGADGSEVLAHLPPVGTYNSELSPAELRGAVDSFHDHDARGSSLVLFGHGDGGGGPTPEILETAARIADLRGLPTVELADSEAFFTELEAAAGDLPTLTGELYFEYHRGTYTSQARTKRGNLLGERLLHQAEAASAFAWALGMAEYPAERLAPLWQSLLLHQFHDVLPGTSVREVHATAEREHAEVAKGAAAIRDEALRVLASEAGGPGTPVNLTAFARREVVESPADELMVVECAPYAAGRGVEARASASACADGDLFTLRNENLSATLDRGGRLLSLSDGEREALAGAGNVLEVYEDRPTAFDAWELEPYHEETRLECGPAEQAEVLREGPLRAEVRFRHRIGNGSTLEQRVRLDAGSRRLEFRCRIDWHERHRVLKVAFPLLVHAQAATYGAQFGVHRRPTHRNTAADLARFEVPGRRFADLSEHGFGVALLTDSTHGFSACGNELRLTLLRGPTDPDPEADLGEHAFAYAVLPHAGDWAEGNVVAEAACFSEPLVWADGELRAGSWAAAEPAALVLDTIKRSEDGEALVLRLYESRGSRGIGLLRLGMPVAEAVSSNALEDPRGSLEVTSEGISVPYTPFELITIRLRLAPSP